MVLERLFGGNSWDDAVGGMVVLECWSELFACSFRIRKRLLFSSPVAVSYDNRPVGSF
jgi:hypothetical protein